MFDERIYGEFKKSAFFRQFVLYCVIGACAFSVIGLLLIFSAKYCRLKYIELISLICGICCFFVPLGFIIGAVGKPYLCAEGEIISLKSSFAVVRVGDKEIRASSFEHFLKNSSLKNYSVGDKVVIYSRNSKLNRPLFV